MNEETQEEYSLTDEDSKIIESLSDTDIQKIDKWLLKNITKEWQKVAMVVVKAIEESDKVNELTTVPDTFFGMRIEALANSGKITAQGNLKKMHFSEIKYAQ